MEEVWDVCNPSWDKNFVCKLNNRGRWDRKEFKRERGIYGKWIFTISQVNEDKNAPTFADQRNFITGLMETEWRNDNFVFPDGKQRNPQKKLKIKMFKEFLDDTEKNINSSIPNGITSYINKERIKQNGSS